MSRIARLGATMAGVFGIGLGGPGGCGVSFPEDFGWYANSPNLYTSAFRAAIEEAIVRDRTGKNYFDHMGDRARFIGNLYDIETNTYPLCNSETLDNYLVDKSVRCGIVATHHDNNCKNADGCVSVRYNPELLNTGKLKDVIVSAIEDPCEFLTDPKNIERPDVSANYSLTPNEAWRIARCETSRIVGYDVQFDDDEGILRFRFRKGDENAR